MAKEKLQLLIEQHGMQNVKKALKDLDTAAGGTAKSFGAIAAQIGLTVAAGLAIRKVVQVGSDFGKEMARTKSVTFDATKSSAELNAEWDKLEKNARKLGGSTLYTAGEVAGLQTEYAKLGFTVPEIENMSKATLDLALVAGTDLSQASAIAGVTLRAFGMEATQSTEMMDVMAKSFSSSALDIDKFANSMTYVAPVAASAGFSMQETTAVLGTLANVGIDGSIAGTQLRLVFGELANGSSKLSKRLGGPIDNIDDLIPKLIDMRDGGFDATEAFDMVGRRAAPALLSLVENAEGLDSLNLGMQAAAGSLEDMADIQLDTFAGQVTILNSAMEGLAIEIFDMVEGPLTDFVKLFADFIDDIDGEDVATFAIGISGAAIGVGLFTGAIQNATRALIAHRAALAATGYGAIIVGVGLLVSAFLDWTNIFETEIEQTEESTSANKEQKESIDEVTSAQLALAQATEDVLQDYENMKYTPSEALKLLREKHQELADATILSKQALDSYLQSTDDASKRTKLLNDETKSYLDTNKDGQISNKEYADGVASLSDVQDKYNELLLDAGLLVEKEIGGQKQLIPVIGQTSSEIEHQQKLRDEALASLTLEEQGLVILGQAIEQTSFLYVNQGKSIQEIIDTKTKKYEQDKLDEEASQNAINILEEEITTGETQKQLIQDVTALIVQQEEALRKKTGEQINTVLADLQVLETQGKLKEGAFELTEATRDEILERMRNGESVAAIIGSYQEEESALKTLAEKHNDYLEQQKRSNEQSAEAIVFQENEKNEKIAVTEANVALVESLLAEGVAREHISYMLENDIEKFNEFEFIKAEAAITEEERLASQLEFYRTFVQDKEALDAGFFDKGIARLTQLTDHQKKELKNQTDALKAAGATDKEIAVHTAKYKAKVSAATAKASFESLAGGLSAAAQHDKQFAKAAKTAAYTSAVINTYQAATKAAASAPFPTNVPLIAGALAQGFAQVKNIEKQEFGATPNPPGYEPDGNLDDIENRFGTDGPMLVDRPTRFSAGEGYAPEIVDVKPLTMANANLAARYGRRSGGGGGPVTLNISAPLVDEHVVETLIPAIRDAIRQGEMLEG